MFFILHNKQTVKVKSMKDLETFMRATKLEVLAVESLNAKGYWIIITKDRV